MVGSNENIPENPQSITEQQQPVIVQKVEPKKLVKQKPMTLKEQIKYVKKTFRSRSGYLITIEIKQITESQAMLHGIVYDVEVGKEDAIAYEGSLMCPITDQNFKDSQFVIAFNIGEESLASNIKSLITNNASGAMKGIVEFIASIGIKLGVQMVH